ncbi:hypothetical protein B0T26DRAFT_125355 [Lasiosphaeria miniovina]|uniref:Uncharacterized protein n=1 Tax=Lasiosphaeria miniovina TaxID=1954250 RepID=A0AA40B445_9PEZI|nr:uncharacterized protein B0T26DRAFT_125355 [Lasiosphaeria miniovina]KAK0727260.1 hypothetical protein B0T26DRAFT_125355 [Lasiosphaeria miniovina]
MRVWYVLRTLSSLSSVSGQVLPQPKISHGSRSQLCTVQYLRLHLGHSILGVSFTLLLSAFYTSSYPYVGRFTTRGSGGILVSMSFLCPIYGNSEVLTGQSRER